MDQIETSTFPPGIPRAFDSLTCPGGREFDISGCCWGVEFDTRWEGWGNLIDLPRFHVTRFVVSFITRAMGVQKAKQTRARNKERRGALGSIGNRKSG